MKDIVVLGAGLGGLSAAIHCARKDYNVTVYEKSSNIGGKASPIYSDGYTFDPGPSIITVIDVYRELFESFDENIDEYISFKPLDPIFSLTHENGDSFRIPFGREKVLNYLYKNFPEDKDGIERLLDYGERIDRFSLKIKLCKT